MDEQVNVVAQRPQCGIKRCGILPDRKLHPLRGEGNPWAAGEKGALTTLLQNRFTLRNYSSARLGLSGEPPRLAAFGLLGFAPGNDAALAALPPPPPLPSRRFLRALFAYSEFSHNIGQLNNFNTRDIFIALRVPIGYNDRHESKEHWQYPKRIRRKL